MTVDDSAGNSPSGGLLALVVGPSGAGKDTLIDAARSVLAADPHWHFPRRLITRPETAGGEAHEAIAPGAFAARAAAGGFALHWRAHDLGYGVPAAIDGMLAAGVNVLVNVSRGVIGEARSRYPRLRVFVITAPRAELARRLAARGRESEADIARRLARAPADMPSGADVLEFENAGPVQETAARFVAALRRAAAET